MVVFRTARRGVSDSASLILTSEVVTAVEHFPRGLVPGIARNEHLLALPPMLLSPFREYEVSSLEVVSLTCFTPALLPGLSIELSRSAGSTVSQWTMIMAHVTVRSVVYQRQEAYQ